MWNRSTYWINLDSTRVTLHKGTCRHVEIWAPKSPKKWTEFPTEKAARDSTRSKIRECGDCMSRRGGDVSTPPPPVNRCKVVERMSACVMSEIRKNPESDWESASERIKREFARESAALHSHGQCAYPDGADLIWKAATRQAPRIRNTAIRKMITELVSAVENAPRNMALWRPVKQEDIPRKNSLAIGVLWECDLSAPNGSDLIAEALSKSGLRIVSRCDVMNGIKVEYLTKRQNVKWLTRILRFILKRAYVIICLLAALFALIGITIWDIIPIPCDLWPFYQFPRCS